MRSECGQPVGSRRIDRGECMSFPCTSSSKPLERCRTQRKDHRVLKLLNSTTKRGLCCTTNSTHGRPFSQTGRSALVRVWPEIQESTGRACLCRQDRSLWRLLGSSFSLAGCISPFFLRWTRKCRAQRSGPPAAGSLSYYSPPLQLSQPRSRSQLLLVVGAMFSWPGTALIPW